MRVERQESPDGNAEPTRRRLRSAAGGSADERAFHCEISEWIACMASKRPNDGGARSRGAPATRDRSSRRSTAPTSCATASDDWCAASESDGKSALNRQCEGHDLDVDAMIDAGIALRTVVNRIRACSSSTAVHRDLAALL